MGGERKTDNGQPKADPIAIGAHPLHRLPHGGFEMVLENKTAIVTGAGSGLGRAGAIALAHAGAAVLASDLNEAAARETVDAIARQGGRAWAFAADAGNAADAERMVGAA